MKLIRFVLDNKIIKTDERDLTISQIEETKESLAMVFKCTIGDIDVIFEERDYSEYDIGVKGIYKWTDLYPRIIRGVGLSIKEGSDEHLDSLLNGTLEKYLIFI